MDTTATGATVLGLTAADAVPSARAKGTPGMNTAMIMSDDDRWRAVTENDTAADGQFVYAVVTTGIYCRPSCRSRQPKRENVRYFDTAEMAAAAGYKACKRCGGGKKAEDPMAAAVAETCRLLETADEAAPTLADLAQAVGVSAFHLQRSFKRLVGVTPRAYWDARRVERLKDGLHDGETVTNALYDAGYGSSSRLYEKSNSVLGMTPARWGRGGEGAVVSWATAETDLGRLLVARTEAGVCFVALGKTDDQLLEELRAALPKAAIAPDHAGLTSEVSAVLDIIAGRAPSSALPVEVQATAFQRAVWQALTSIPKGEVWSYAQVAEAIDNPKAVRAVGQACARNPVALLVPCHRVVGADGSTSGYRWGEDRKKALIAREKKKAATRP